MHAIFVGFLTILAVFNESQLISIRFQLIFNRIFNSMSIILNGILIRFQLIFNRIFNSTSIDFKWNFHSVSIDFYSISIDFQSNF